GDRRSGDTAHRRDRRMNGWLLVSLVSTFAVAVIGSWALLREGARSVTAAPPGNLPSLPWGWRLGWPVVARLAPAVAVLVGPGQRERLRQALARAGLDVRLRAEHFVAAQLALAIALAAGAGVVLAVL